MPDHITAPNGTNQKLELLRKNVDQTNWNNQIHCRNDAVQRDPHMQIKWCENGCASNYFNPVPMRKTNVSLNATNFVKLFH